MPAWFYVPSCVRQVEAFVALVRIVVGSSPRQWQNVSPPVDSSRLPEIPLRSLTEKEKTVNSHSRIAGLAQERCASFDSDWGQTRANVDRDEDF